MSKYQGLGVKAQFGFLPEYTDSSEKQSSSLSESNAFIIGLHFDLFAKQTSPLSESKIRLDFEGKQRI